MFGPCGSLTTLRVPDKDWQGTSRTCEICRAGIPQCKQGSKRGEKSRCFSRVLFELQLSNRNHRKLLAMVIPASLSEKSTFQKADVKTPQSDYHQKLSVHGKTQFKEVNSNPIWRHSCVLFPHVYDCLNEWYQIWVGVLLADEFYLLVLLRTNRFTDSCLKFCY